MRLQREFYLQDVSVVAPKLLGKYLVRKFNNGEISRTVITETEAYGGEKDMASHARFGKTSRNSVMYEQGGFLYVYLIYGIYWMLNVVTGKQNSPQAILIRSLDGVVGPGKVGKFLEIDKSFNQENLDKSKRIWIEENSNLSNIKYLKRTRVGVDYAKMWAKRKWRFIQNN